MILRLVLHLEWHRGYRPVVHLRRAPRAGDRVTDGGWPGVLTGCRTCSTVGFLHVPDHLPATVEPTEATP